MSVAGTSRLEPKELSQALLAAEQAMAPAVEALVRGRSHVQALVAKGDYDFATVVDVEIEHIVREQLGRLTPGVPMLGEETGGALSGATSWILDPIDGTANYADGSPLCAISLALLHDGRPVVGLVEAPLIGERYTAIDGGGAFCNGSPIGVARTNRGSPLAALSDFAFGGKHQDTNALRLALIDEFVARGLRLRLHGCCALDLAWLAAGRISIAVALSNRAWDVSAGLALVREAGGLTFDHEGLPHEPASTSSIASVPWLKGTALEALSEAIRSSGERPG